MKVPIDPALKRIARAIVDEKKTVDEWAEIESDDMFQDGDFCGGFDADEGEFCFSYESPDGEVWFQLTLEQCEQIAAGQTPGVQGRPAE